jgi:pilus assembly protein CpaD
MRSRIAPRAASGFRPAASSLLVVSLLSLGLAGCKTIEDEPGAHVAGFTLIDPSQRHPIMVSQEPATMSIRVARGARGLSPGQKDQVAAFLGRYRGADSGNSKLVLLVPSGSPNESAAVLAVGDMRRLISDFGFADSAIVIEPYRELRDAGAPIRLSYLRYIAEAPQCARWTSNVAEDRRNLPYPNFGCAQQHNLAAQIANPADLLGPRTMDPADSERRTIVYDKYRQGKSTAAEKSTDERVQVKGAD